MRKILIFVLLSGCVVIPTQQARQMLDAAESCMNERPDSALVLLEGIDAGSLRTRNLRARHALLHTMALDKNYMDITEPGLLDPAVGYYSRHGTPDERMKTFQYQGRILQSKHMLGEAAVSFFKAEQWADKAQDKHAVGLLFLTYSHLYNRVNNVQKELEYAEKGVRVLEEAGDPMAQMALGQLALAHHTMQHWGTADSLYQAGIKASTSNPKAMRVFLPNYARMKLQQPEPDPEGALALFDRMIREYNASLSAKDAGAYAFAKVLKGDVTTAETILQSLKSTGQDNDLTVLPWLYKLEASRGDYERAYSLLREMRIQENNEIYSTLTDSVTEALSNYHDSQAQLEARRKKNQLRLFVLMLVGVLTAVGWGIRRTWNRHHRLLELKESLEAELAENKSTQRQAESEMASKLERAREEYTREKLARLKQAGTLGSIVMLQERHLIDDTLAWDNLKKDILYIHHLEKKGEVLVRRLDQELDGMISRLRVDLKLWGKPQEVLFLCCCILNMDMQLLAELTHATSIDAVYKKRSRLWARIRRLNNPEYEVLLKK